MRRIPKCEMTETDLESVGNLIFKKYLRDDFSIRIKKQFLEFTFFEKFFSFKRFQYEYLIINILL